MASSSSSSSSPSMFASPSSHSSSPSRLSSSPSSSSHSRSSPLHRLALPMLLLLAMVVIASFEVQSAEAMTSYRMRTDKKAMRNSLVRFGKRAYRPAGEAFVSAVDLADGGWMGSGADQRRGPSPIGGYRSFFAPRPQQQMWNGGGGGDQAMLMMRGE